MTLNVREKILIYVLVIVLVLFGGIKLIVMPISQGYLTDSAALFTLTQQKNKAQNDVLLSKQIDVSKQTVLSEAIKSSQLFYPSLSNEYLNVLAVNLALSNGFTVYSIRFSAAGGSSTAAIGAISPDGNYLLKNLAEQFNNAVSGIKSQVAAVKPADGSVVVARDVTLNMTGTSYTNIKGFLSAVKLSGKTVIVTAFNCTKAGVGYQVTATLRYFGAEQLAGSSNTSYWPLSPPSGQTGIM